MDKVQQGTRPILLVDVLEVYKYYDPLISSIEESRLVDQLDYWEPICLTLAIENGNATAMAGWLAGPILQQPS